MFRPRNIPVLLLKEQGLVKTNRFDKSKTRYIGDPMNAVKIFNDLKADELVFLDINASINKTTISYDLVRDIADEAYMPFAVGGGIKNIKEVETLLKLGAERVIINTNAIIKENFIKDLVNEFGSSSIIVSVDIKQNIYGNYKVYHTGGTKKSNLDLVEYLKRIENQGAGEIFFQSMDRDGTYKGYDINMIKFVSENTTVPIVPCGGCSSFEDFNQLGSIDGISGYAAGSVFVFYGARKAVLINYPSK